MKWGTPQLQSNISPSARHSASIACQEKKVWTEIGSSLILIILCLSWTAPHEWWMNQLHKVFCAILWLNGKAFLHLHMVKGCAGRIGDLEAFTLTLKQIASRIAMCEDFEYKYGADIYLWRRGGRWNAVQWLVGVWHGWDGLDTSMASTCISQCKHCNTVSIYDQLPDQF